jgi:hypothetical protein
MLVPAAIAGLAGIAAVVQGKRQKVAATPATVAARQAIFEAALNDVKDPNKLRVLADAYHAQGLHAEGTMLQKRAALQELPASVKEARRDAFRKAMSSKNVPAILEMATVYESEGATGAAENLRKYASGLADQTVEVTTP